MARLTVDGGKVEITLTVEAAPLHTKPGRYPSELLPATLHLTYTWKADEGEWGAYWAVRGHRRLLSGRWSEKPIVSVDSCDLAEVPGWIGEAVYEFRPSVDLGRSAEIAADMADGPACRVCGCTENAPCEGGCTWVPDPHGGDVCSSHFVPAADLGPGALVRSTEWADGELVRILSVAPIDGLVAVRYQDTAAHRPATLVHVNPGFPVLPEGGDAL